MRIFKLSQFACLKVKIWFQNRRSKYKKINKQPGGHNSSNLTNVTTTPNSNKTTNPILSRQLLNNSDNFNKMQACKSEFWMDDLKQKHSSPSFFDNFNNHAGQFSQNIPQQLATQSIASFNQQPQNSPNNEKEKGQEINETKPQIFNSNQFQQQQQQLFMLQQDQQNKLATNNALQHYMLHNNVEDLKFSGIDPFSNSWNDFAHPDLQIPVTNSFYNQEQQLQRVDYFSNNSFNNPSTFYNQSSPYIAIEPSLSYSHNNQQEMINHKNQLSPMVASPLHSSSSSLSSSYSSSHSSVVNQWFNDINTDEKGFNEEAGFGENKLDTNKNQDNGDLNSKEQFNDNNLNSKPSPNTFNEKVNNENYSNEKFEDIDTSSNSVPHINQLLNHKLNPHNNLEKNFN